MMNRAQRRAARHAPRTSDRHIDRIANFAAVLRHTPIGDNAVHAQAGVPKKGRV